MSVSFIIINYNYSEFINRAIYSIFAQKNQSKSFDLIVVDDGSTDDSISEIISSFSKYKNRFRNSYFLFNSKNRGKLACLNDAITQAKGEFTVILDSDDFLTTHFLDTQLKVFKNEYKESHKLAFVYSDSLLINKSEEVICGGFSREFNMDEVFNLSYIPETALTLTKVLYKCLPFDHSIKVGTKHHKWKKVCTMGYHGKHIAEPLFYYRMHSKNLSGIGDKIINELKESHDPNESYKNRILSGYWSSST
ncbi:glycosyltransferase family A protein [Microbulbifer sp. ANSA001]|uniref:glycosyltransferase family A protein n=1 Tax=Microbulbifer sp. ANSA001 TaxID=3243358 RepID=UPI0040415947